jgi:hypothetical protein
MRDENGEIRWVSGLAAALLDALAMAPAGPATRCRPELWVMATDEPAER